MARKAVIVVHTDSCVLLANLTVADISESASGHLIIDRICKRWPWAKRLFAGSAYDRLKLIAIVPQHHVHYFAAAARTISSITAVPAPSCSETTICTTIIVGPVLAFLRRSRTSQLATVAMVGAAVYVGLAFVIVPKVIDEMRRTDRMLVRRGGRNEHMA